MPIDFPLPRKGACANCGQHWSVSAPAFDVYCPQCHALVMRLNGFARVGHALAIAAVVGVFGSLLTLAMATVVGTTGLIVGVSVTAITLVGGGVWTYLAVRKYRTVARPVRNYARGLARP